MREIPIPLQLPDWNSWLPKVHPLDAFGAASFNTINSGYSGLRTALQPGTAAAYTTAKYQFQNWWNAEQIFLGPIEANAAANSNAGWNTTVATNVYSLAQWMLVKQWEMNQEFGLEGMPQALFGSKADLRAWYGNLSFNTSPIMLHIPTKLLANGTDAAHHYLAYVWYHTQLLLNDGQGQQTQSNPIDFGYAQGSVKDLSIHSGGTPAAMIDLIWLVKGLQEETVTGKGPQYASSNGFSPTAVTPYILLNTGWGTDWSATSPATRTSLTAAYVQAWFAQVSIFTPAQYDAGSDGGGRHWASPTENPVPTAISTPLEARSGTCFHGSAGLA